MFFEILICVVFLLFVFNKRCSIKKQCAAVYDATFGVTTGLSKFWPDKTIPVENTDYILAPWNDLKCVSFAKRFLKLQFGTMGTNIDIDDSKLVIAQGSIQLYFAYAYGISEINSRKPISCLVQAPTFFDIIPIFDIFNGSVVTKKQLKSKKCKTLTPSCQVVISPNNPDGRILKSIKNLKYTLYDYIYCWPHFTLKQKPDLSNIKKQDFITSTSKIGLSGTRFGIAIIHDDVLRAHMRSYVALGLGVSRSSIDYLSQLSDTEILANIDTCVSILRERWDHIKSLKNLRKYLLNEQGSFTYWALPTSEFKKYGVLGYSGSRFLDNPNYTRLNMVGDDFECLYKKLLKMDSDYGNKKHEICA